VCVSLLLLSIKIYGSKRATSDDDVEEKDRIEETNQPTNQQEMPLTPVLELKDDKKWVVEYQKDNQNLVIENPQPKHVVALYKCDNVVVTIKGKVNSISVDNCTKTAIVFDNAISSVELVNCKKVQVQVNEKVPTISVDKCAGVSIFLSNDSLDTAVVSSLSSEMNVYVPNGDESTELPIPDQFTTTYDKVTKKLKTVEGTNAVGI
jgi:adenylyl cyclase-associated protein